MRKYLLAVLVALLVVPVAHATCGGGGGGGIGGMMPGGMGQMNQMPQPRAYLVPWRLFGSGNAPPPSAMTLFWFPASATDADLRESRMLLSYTSQCVGMEVVKWDDAANLAKFQVAADKLPAALLVGEDGKVLAHVDAEDGHLKLSKVENMVHDAVFERETALETQLDDARKKADTGDKDGAIAVYQKVWEQRCIAPKKGRAAQKGLKKLGVEVRDQALRLDDPNLSPEMNERMTTAMNRALEAELATDYEAARRLYTDASKIDPNDPVPLRFLGELYRHNTGEWALANTTFRRVLSMQPDVLSKAVALHGIGKMTIHMGNSAKGLELFEKSIDAYPLPLTYRNLAVYWNSEGQHKKADGYVQKALALDPHDSYNLIFAATYLADSGRREEALRIAQENENLLAASYNLAAIYSLLGNKGKAMEMLKRHFYTYERYDQVRAHEMWEARVDYVFASMKDDPEFVQLTAMAK
jgi:tetratricopeptide (TPR) repeat protein